MTMKREPSISEQQAREIVERMGRRESRSEKSMDDFYRNIGLEPEHLAQPVKTITKKAETATVDDRSGRNARRSGSATEACQQQTTQAVAGRVPYRLPASSQDNRPQARVRQR